MIDITKKIDKMIVINNQGNITITMDSLMDNLLQEFTEKPIELNSKDKAKDFSRVALANTNSLLIIFFSSILSYTKPLNLSYSC